MMGNERLGLLSSRRLIDRYFLESENPYSKRRPLKMKTLAWILGVILVLFVLGVLLLGGKSDLQDAGATPDFRVPPGTPQTTSGLAGGQLPGSLGRSSQGSSSSGSYFSLGGGAGNHSTPTHSANQVIRRGAGGNDPGSALPLGFGIPVRLLNAIRSTDSATPVIAEVSDDVLAHGTVSIPARTRVIGNAQYDEASRRIQLRFQTFVYPEGDQHAVQGIGMMGDGSSGLDGDYHSGAVQKQVGRFLGYFIGGMADGMKDSAASGPLGIPYQPGSIKNGVLNGVALSAEDEAKESTDDLNRTKPFMTLSSGQSFVLFLEREYIP